MPRCHPAPLNVGCTLASRVSIRCVSPLSVATVSAVTALFCPPPVPAACRVAASIRGDSSKPVKGVIKRRKRGARSAIIGNEFSGLTALATFPSASRTGASTSASARCVAPDSSQALVQRVQHRAFACACAPVAVVFRGPLRFHPARRDEPFTRPTPASTTPTRSR
jgi:hypothetical protein